jgi:septation ring formation regulator EzrA
METTDLTLSILQNIRTDIAKLEAKHDARFDRIDARLDAHDARFDAHDDRFQRIEFGMHELLGAVLSVDGRCDRLYERLHEKLVESNVRMTTAHQELQDTLHQLMSHLGQHGSLAARIDPCERDIIDLKERVL